MTRFLEVGKRETPPYASEVVVVPWADPLQIEVLLPVCGPLRRAHSLLRILERIRYMAKIIELITIRQLDRIVGQWVFPSLGLSRPGIPVPGSQLFRRS